MTEVAQLPLSHQRGLQAVEQTTKLRAGVGGLGKQALDDHIPGLLGSDAAELVAICDSSSEVLRERQIQLGVPGYTEADAMFAAEQLDLVVVCVPHSEGQRIVELAAEHGVHVLKEKPFATSVDEAKQLAAACDKAGIRLMVTLQRRFNPIYTSFPQLADQIGTPMLVHAAYTMHTTDPSEGWRGRAEQAGGGCIIDMGYHLVDMLLWYFGLPDRLLADISTSARPDRSYDTEDTALIHFSYDSGLYGSLLLSRFIGPKAEEIRLVGNKGMVHLERGRIRRLNNDGEVVESLSREQSWPSASVSQINHFCRVIEGMRENVSGPSENLAHLAFIQSCYESAFSRTYVNPKELL